MDFLKQPIFYVIVIVAISVAAIWTYVGNKKTKTAEETPSTTVVEKISNLTNLTPGDFESTVKDEYALAASKATLADPILKLSSIEIEIAGTLDPGSVNTRYIFSSASDSINNWTIVISAIDQNFLRALIPKEDYAGELTAIDTGLWKYNYVTALQLAEQSGGLTWREQNNLTGVKLTLKNAGSHLVWIVEYKSADGNNIITLDANSGKMVEN